MRDKCYMGCSFLANTDKPISLGCWITGASLCKAQSKEQNKKKKKKKQRKKILPEDLESLSRAGRQRGACPAQRGSSRYCSIGHR